VSRTARHVVLVAGLALLGTSLLIGLHGLPHFGHFAGRYSRILAYSAVPERHSPNTVVDAAFDYRALDTLGEEMILFTAALGVALLLRSRRDDEERQAAEEVADREEAETSVALRWLGTALVGPVALLGIYVVAHGHLSPGGGFQGGVVLVTAVVLPLLAGRYVLVTRLRGHTLVEISEAAGAAGFVLIGLGGLIAAGAFLQNFVTKGPPGLIQSGGTIPLANLAVGLEVAGALIVVAVELEDPRFLQRGGRQ
jgi:multicomponent Na+:H+ antiporter subunit B